MRRLPDHSVLVRLGEWRWSIAAIVLLMGLLARFAVLGADWDWLVAMGDYVRRTGEIPRDVPFAVADSSGWHDVPVLAQLLASVLHDLSPRGAVVLHLTIVAVALALLAWVGRRLGGSDVRVASGLVIVVVGALPALVVMRLQTWSLLLFPVLIVLVLLQARHPTRGIWWAPVLVALWGNLHGAALLGVCVLGSYLLFGRLHARPPETIGVGVTSLLALFANPQLWKTPAYYAGVFDNVSATRGEGLWARPSLGEPFDVLMLTAAALLAVMVLRRRRNLWEYVALLGLALATLEAARHGVWLLFFLGALALGRPSDNPRRQLETGALAAPAASVVLGLAVCLPIALGRGDAVLGADPEVVRQVMRVADDKVVLAPAPLVEALAVSGVRVWVTNPVDAFSVGDQAAYLDFLGGLPGGADGFPGRRCRDAERHASRRCDGLGAGLLGGVLRGGMDLSRPPLTARCRWGLLRSSHDDKDRLRHLPGAGTALSRLRGDRAARPAPRADHRR